MACQPIHMKDGSVVYAIVKPGHRLTAKDEEALAEFAQFCRDVAAQRQRDRNAAMLPGAKKKE